MKVMLIGGQGFIGSRVVRALRAQDVAVRCLVRPTSVTSRLDGLAWERVDGDITDGRTVVEGAANCDGIIHLASPSAWKDINSPALESVGITGTRNVLDAAKALGIKVVYVSSVAAVAASESPRVFDEESEYNLAAIPELRYSHVKHEAELLCRAAANEGVDVVIVNPAEVYGPEDDGLITAKSLIDFLSGGPALVCRGGTSIVHVDDVADGIVNALKSGRSGERYILGGDNLTIRELAALTLSLVGRKPQTATLPTGLLRGVAKFAVATRMPMPFEPRVIPYATRYWFVDNQKAQRVLGVRFRPAADVIRPTLEWLQAAGHLEGDLSFRH